LNDILGLDHICASGKNIKGFSKNNDLLDYTVHFIEKDIPINEEKNDILSDKIKSHDALFLQNSKSISIELIEHHQKTNENMGPYSVIYESNFLPDTGFSIPENSKIVKSLSTVFNTQIYNFVDKKTHLSFFWKNSQIDLGLTTIILETRDLKNSINFWTKNFNFKILQSPELSSCKLLELNSPIKSWNAKLLLIENLDAKIEKLFLNSKGWTCLSFIVKNIDSFLSKIDHSDFSFIGKAYEFKIGGKHLKLIFLRGPEQQLLELVEIKHNHD
jgi:hypothetical protein